MRSIGKELRDGDVILTNHPAAGGKQEERIFVNYINYLGSHLPDFTVITPVRILV
jgi:N-methylhydantoinase B/oxoprolinase/acetone carboxylase alpha subunit